MGLLCEDGPSGRRLFAVERVLDVLRPDSSARHDHVTGEGRIHFSLQPGLCAIVVSVFFSVSVP